MRGERQRSWRYGPALTNADRIRSGFHQSRNAHRIVSVRIRVGNRRNVILLRSLRRTVLELADVPRAARTRLGPARRRTHACPRRTAGTGGGDAAWHVGNRLRVIRQDAISRRAFAAVPAGNCIDARRFTAALRPPQRLCAKGDRARPGPLIATTVRAPCSDRRRVVHGPAASGVQWREGVAVATNRPIASRS